MLRKNRDKNKSKSKSTRDPICSDGEAHDLAPVSSASLPSTDVNRSKPSILSTSFPSPISTRISTDLMSSPNYQARQSGKRKQDMDFEKRIPLLNFATETDLDNIFKNVYSNHNPPTAPENTEERYNGDEEDNNWDGLEGLKFEEPDEDGARNEELSSGIQEAADQYQRDTKGEDSESESEPSSSSSSSSGFSSSDSEPGDNLHAANEDPETDAGTESDCETLPEETKPALKRLKRSHPKVFGDDASITTPKTSVATRNPPPPELEGQFKLSNSITGTKVYRYPKPVLDALAELESIIPKTVVEYVEKMPNAKIEAFTKMHEGNEDTKRVLVLLEGSRHLIAHLGKVRVGSDGKAAGEGLGQELMRIARQRGEEVEMLRAQVKALSQTEDKKRKRRSG